MSTFCLFDILKISNHVKIQKNYLKIVKCSQSTFSKYLYMVEFQNFCSISFAKISFSQRKWEQKRTFSLIFFAQFSKFVWYFSEIRELRVKFSQILLETFSKFSRNSLKFSTFYSKSFYFAINTIFLTRNGKSFIFIERKLNENYAKMKYFRNNEHEIFVEGRKSLNLTIP